MQYYKMKDRTELKDVLLQNDVNVVVPQDRTNLGTDEIILEEQIGSGSFSEVYKGKWLGTTVAIKRFLLNQTSDEEILNDFMKETSLMAGLRHPNIVQYMGATVKPPHLYMVTEYCERGNLQSIIRDKRQKLSAKKTTRLALDAARGMLYLHKSTPPILHRDYKSANLLVDRNWTVKVGDFGMSRVLDPNASMTICGTAETCAPEVLARSQYTEKADVYSFGIVLWEMFTREILYPNMNFYELSSRVVNEGLRPPTTGEKFENGKVVPAEIKKLMIECWDPDPNERPSFELIVSRLEKVLEALQKTANRDDISITNGKRYYVNDF